MNNWKLTKIGLPEKFQQFFYYMRTQNWLYTTGPPTESTAVSRDFAGGQNISMIAEPVLKHF